MNRAKRKNILYAHCSKIGRIVVRDCVTGYGKSLNRAHNQVGYTREFNTRAS